MRDIVERWKRESTIPPILVVGLGTNDCSASVFERHVRRILSAAGDRPVVWVNTWRSGCDLAVNDVLLGIQKDELNARADGGNLWIVDHWSWVNSNRGVLSTDRIHLNRPGYKALRRPDGRRRRPMIAPPPPVLVAVWRFGDGTVMRLERCRSQVDRASLLRRCGGNLTVGSNPTLSATRRLSPNPGPRRPGFGRSTAAAVHGPIRVDLPRCVALS